MCRRCCGSGGWDREQCRVPASRWRRAVRVDTDAISYVAVRWPVPGWDLVDVRYDRSLRWSECEEATAVAVGTHGFPSGPVSIGGRRSSPTAWRW